MENIVIFRIGHLGDTVVALPCFHLIARAFPNARRTLVTNIPASRKAAPVEGVLAGSGLIDDVIYFPPAPRRFGDFLELASKIRATKARKLIYIADRHTALRPVMTTLRDILFFRACGLREFVGASTAKGLRKLRIDAGTGHTEREAERLARCLAQLGSVDFEDPANWDLRLQPAELAAADTALAPLRGHRFIAINAGGKIAEKDWGDENWFSLLRLMSGPLSDLALVFFGSPDEAERANRMAAAWPGVTLNLCGQLAPRESAAAMRRAALFLGHDSGPMHLAAAAGTTCVAMFGHINMPKWWYPWGDHHRILHDMNNVRAIPPQAVYEAVASVAGDISPARCHQSR